MNSIKAFVFDAIGTMKSKMPKLKQPIKWVVYLYFGIVALLVLTYYGAWLYQMSEGEVALNDLLSLIREMVGTSMVAFVTFIAGCMIDTDRDGIPDQFEKEERDRDAKNRF